MNKNKLKKFWKSEEIKVFEGWDFSYLNGRIDEEDLPWSYNDIVKDHLKDSHTLLDMGTGGGEFLLTLGHPYKNTSVTESYLLNVDLCRKRLGSLGIDVNHVIDDSRLPFTDNSFDIIINRHESYDISEVYRILKNGGLFITQQVGGDNNVEFSNHICRSSVREKDFINTLDYQVKEFLKAGFSIIDTGEYYPYLKFFDTGAVVYFAKIIEWEFIDFSVEECFDELVKMEDEINNVGYVTSREHRYLIVAYKK